MGGIRLVFRTDAANRRAWARHVHHTHLGAFVEIQGKLPASITEALRPKKPVTSLCEKGCPYRNDFEFGQVFCLLLGEGGAWTHAAYGSKCLHREQADGSKK